jgi:hypothetical protein
MDMLITLILSLYTVYIYQIITLYPQICIIILCNFLKDVFTLSGMNKGIDNSAI